MIIRLAHSSSYRSERFIQKYYPVICNKELGNIRITNNNIEINNDIVLRNKMEKCIKRYIVKKRELKSKYTSKIDLTEFNSIYNFNNNEFKSNNDLNNKVRETIIKKILNNEIPEEYYMLSYRWTRMRNNINDYINKLLEKDTERSRYYFTIKTISCELKAGRTYNYDYKINIKYYLNKDSETEINKDFKIEFKFGASCVNECPQFASPMKPSQYFKNNINYEEWHYDNVLPLIVEKANTIMPEIIKPEKQTYLKTIHSNKVECMQDFKKLYDKNTDFNKSVKKIDKEKIKEFLESQDLTENMDIEKLTKYLLKSQESKYYMCYHNNTFYIDKVSDDNFKITKVYNIIAPNIICMTESGYSLEVKLRWKNGNSIQFPAFQIKRKIPLKSSLVEICETNDIKRSSSMNKPEILRLLDSKKIIY